MTDSPATKPDSLDAETLTRLQPGLARLMPEIGARFWKAYYAAEAGNWPLAQWQMREMRKLFLVGEVTRPKYIADIDAWLADEYAPLMTALEQHDFAAFQRQYHEAVDSANDYHRRWKKAWIRWKLPQMPPPDLDLAPVDE